MHGTEGSPTSLTPIVDPSVKDLLQEHQERDSLTRGTIVDLATISTGDPFENFELDTDLITNHSKRLVEKIASTGRHQDCIALAVSLPSDDVFVDLFTYESSATSEFPSIESLAMELGVDISSVHHLIGKDVDIVRNNGRWVICEHLDTPPLSPSVTKRDFLNPILISGLAIPLGILIGWQTEYSILYTSIVGTIGALVLSALLLYLTLAVKRDHPLPGILGRLFTPDYTGDAGVIMDSDGISDVKNGEFRRLITLVDEDDEDSHRAVLHNLAVVATVPPAGEKVIPIPAPTTCWHETTIKGLIFSLSSSIETLDRAEGKLIPLRRNGDRIEVDRSRLSWSEKHRGRTFSEKVADTYVRKINNLFNTGERTDIYQ